MSFYHFTLVFVTSLSTNFYVISSAGNHDSNLYSNSEHAAENSSFQYESSIGTKSNSKRSREDTIASIKPKKVIKEYYRNTKPMILNFDKNTANSLASWERQLRAGGTEYVWKDFKNLKKNDIKHLCIEAWKIQQPRIKGLKVKSGMTADCSFSYLPGPSKPYLNNNKYTGYFQYADDLKNLEFYPDLVRCNCAYLKLMDRSRIIKTAFNTKKFFYLLKYTDITYIIFVPHDQAVSRKVKIVNVCAINILKPLNTVAE